MLINWKLLWTVIDWALKVPKKASDLRAAMRYQGPVRRIKPFLMERAVIAVRARSRWLLALKCVLQSIDNASFQKRSAKYGTKHERLAQLVALSATQAWTAMGLTSLSSGVADSMGLTNATQSLQGSNEAERLYKMVEQGFDFVERSRRWLRSGT